MRYKHIQHTRKRLRLTRQDRLSMHKNSVERELAALERERRETDAFILSVRLALAGARATRANYAIAL